VALFGRVAYLQTTASGPLRDLALRQQAEAVEVRGSRGRIYDRFGRELATNVVRDSVYAVPRAIQDPEAFARAVAPVLRLPPREVAQRVRRGGYFVWLARQARPEVVSRLRALRLDGQIGFEPEPQRTYPAGHLAAHVLGFAGVDSQGLAGVELQYDNTLRGKPGRVLRVRDALGREILEGRQVLQQPQDGADLVLTLDRVAQHVAERELERTVAQHRARAGAVVVMDVHTGELLALASVPHYNPNRYGDFPEDSWRNRAVAEAYEPGSTLKLAVLAAGMEAGVVSPTSRFTCPGSLRVPGGHTIREAHGQAHGVVDLSDIVRLSCNVGAAQVGARLGAQRLHRALEHFGFGEPTGVDLPGESPGILRPPSAWSATDPYVVGIGQGVAATPLQVARFVAAVANGGRLVRPHVAAAVREPQAGLRRLVDPTPAPRVLSPGVAASLLSMMERTVTDGTGTAAAVEGYRVAGKTGTAQKPSPSGGYEPGRYVASFVGVVPADRPRVVVLVLVDEPQGAYYGGVVAAPAFARIAAQTLWALGIPPSGSGVARPRPRAEGD
jgi:cell division protein FtsI/penicillin-binding protein 2